MRVRMIGAILVLALIVCAPACACNGDWRFAVLCDSRAPVVHEKTSDDHKCSAVNGGVSTILAPVVQDILCRHQNCPIDLALFPGDMIAGLFKRDASSVAECNRIMLRKWLETMDPLTKEGVKLRVTVGNHEATEGGAKCGVSSYEYRPNLELFRVFKETLKGMTGDNGPPSDMGVTYSFDHKDCHFAVLSAYTMNLQNAFSAETLAWLEKDLQNAKAAGKRLFVASHPPAFPGSSHMFDSLPYLDCTYRCENYHGIDRRLERDRFWNTLKKYGVIAYFCGHEHNIQVQKVDGVWHVVSGALTEKLAALNGTPGSKHPNRVLYDAEFYCPRPKNPENEWLDRAMCAHLGGDGAARNPRGKEHWPEEDDRSKYWGWCLVTVNKERVKLEIFGTKEKPGEDSYCFDLLKDFVLWEKTSEGNP